MAKVLSGPLLEGKSETEIVFGLTLPLAAFESGTIPLFANS
jgi:hypothetical protein